MRIVIDGRCIHPNMGGIGRAAREQVRALSQLPSPHEWILLVGPAAAPESVPPGVATVSVPGAMIDEAFDQFHLPSLLDRLKVDLYWNPTFSLPAVKTTRFQMATIHDVVFEDEPQWVESRLRGFLQRWSRFSAVEADRVVTVSKFSKSRIEAVYGTAADRVVVVPNGLEPAFFSRPSPREISEVRAKHRLPDDFVLYLGSVEPKKGLAELISAFGRLAAAGYPGELLLAGGDGGGRFEIRPGDRIRRLGYVPEEDRPALICASNLFIYPSLYEGFGLPPLEAMALGVPTLVSSSTSLPEIVGDAAIVVDVRDERTFAEAMRHALDDPELRRRAAVDGPERARIFTAERSARELLNVCDSLEAA